MLSSKVPASTRPITEVKATGKPPKKRRKAPKLKRKKSKQTRKNQKPQRRKIPKQKPPGKITGKRPDSLFTGDFVIRTLISAVKCSSGTFNFNNKFVILKKGTF